MYKIREARLEDFTPIALIHDDPENSHLLGEQESLDQAFWEKIAGSKTEKVYVVEKSGEIVGFILFYVKTAENTIYLERFSIRKDYRKKGIDEHLYAKVTRLAEHREIKQMIANITTADRVVQTFFIEKGWQSRGTDNLYVRNL